MGRFQGLLIAAALVAGPAGAAAGPSQDRRPAEYATFEKFEMSMSKGRLGVTLLGLTPELRKHFGATEASGVLVARIEPDSPAARAGIAVGDVVTDVRGRSIAHGTEVVSALADVTTGQSVAVTLVRDGKPLTLQVAVTEDAPMSVLDGSWPALRWLQDVMQPFRTERITNRS